ncbi:MAG TPA: hypothetical protein VGO84_11420 [Burkholderiales bacterium]|nr:hypothetical protein [Burkholderiales bacterium]
MLARFTGKAGGIDDLQIAEYPGPLGIHEAPEIEKNIADVLVDRIVTGLTSSTAGGARKSPAEHDPAAPVFTGTAEEVDRYFLEQEWSDGLPIVAPTVERVERFLHYTDRQSDAEIAILPSANLRATPWNIAVNGVIAGCRPEHMPLLVAAVEALADPECLLASIGSSSGIFPYVLVNGPLARELGFENGAQLVSRGANPALGRAVGLIVKNIAGFRPGASYMGTFGYMLGFALAENEAESPWEPFHASRGFTRRQSTVTIGVTNNWGPSPAAYSAQGQSGARSALELIAKEIKSSTRLFNFPARGADAERVMLTILMSPSIAQSLAAAGYSKEDIRHYLYENTRMSLREFDWVLKYTTISGQTAKERADEGVFPPEFAGSPDDNVRVLSSPDILHIVVCGDPHRNRIMVLEGGHTYPVTKEIVLPAQWSQLLKQH